MKTRRFQLMAGLCLFGACGGAQFSLHAQSLQFVNVRRLTNKEVALTLSAPVGRAYRIEAATNLPDWNGLLTFPTNVTTSLQHTDSAAPYLAARYYRAVQLTGSNILSGDHLSTTNGDLVIHPHQHAAIILGWNGKIIYIDPKSDISSYAGQPRGNLVLVTHHHGDHLNTTTIDTVRSNNAPILCPLMVYNSLTAAQKTTAIVLANGAVTNILGMTVEAVPAYNISNSNHPLGVGNGYVLTLGGRRIYIAGDTEDTPAMRALTNIDVAFVPINRPFTMFVSNAVSAVREFRPGIVYPYHYSPSTPTTDVNLFKQQVGTDLGIEVRLRKWY